MVEDHGIGLAIGGSQHAADHLPEQPFRCGARAVLHADVGMPVESVVVEIEFRVESEQLAFRRHDERIDFYHGTITLHEELEEIAEELGRLVHQRTGQPESGGDVARLVGHEPKSGIHADAKDFFRRLLGDRLDVHSAFRAGYDHRR